MLGIMISLSIISIIVFTCNTEAQGPSRDTFGPDTTLNERTLDKIVNQTNAFKGIPHINVGHHPVSVAITPHTDTVYVANFDSGSVSVINGITNAKLPDIRVGGHPTSIAVDPAIDKVYVANPDSGNVSVINGITNAKLPDIRVGGKPTFIAVNTNTHKVYVTTSGNATDLFAYNVSVIDGIHNTKLGDIPIGAGLFPPTSIAVDPDSQNVYVVIPNGVSVIGTCAIYRDPACAGRLYQTKPKVIPTGAVSIAVDPAIGLYVANPDSGNVSVFHAALLAPPQLPCISPTTFKRCSMDIPVGGRPISIAVNENTHEVYAANPSSGKVSVINVSKMASGAYTAKKGKDIPVGSPLGAYTAWSPIIIPSSEFGFPFTMDTPITVNQDTNTVYVGSAINDSLTIIDGITKKVVAGVCGNIICCYSYGFYWYMVNSSADRMDKNKNATQVL
jgi:YVTN family beta-propeller protein